MTKLPEKYEDNFKISIENLFFFLKSLQNKLELHKKTGYVYYAVFTNTENIIFSAENIGKNNTVDKVIGYALLNKIVLKIKIFFISSKISFEMVLKAGKWKIPIIVSKKYSTSFAITLVEKIGLTIIGFLVIL